MDYLSGDLVLDPGGLNIMKFDPSAPCLVIAPHLTRPLRDGGSILIDFRYSHFSQYVPFVDIIGVNTITRYQGGKVISQGLFQNSHRPVYEGSIRTLVKSSHYVLERIITPSYVEAVRKQLKEVDYSTIVFGYTACLSLVELFEKDCLFIVETQNDELKWYRNLSKTVKNPIAKMVARSSMRWITTNISNHLTDAIYIFVTEEDYQGMIQEFPLKYAFVTPVGAQQKNVEYNDRAVDIVKLLFVGSLGLQMNFDALVNFQNVFFPPIKGRLGDRLQVKVVGREPSKRVAQICDANGWLLSPNVSDDELDRLYREATFSIMPFPYSTGAKLKLAETLSFGVPFLATIILAGQVERELAPCLFSDDPDEWVKSILHVLDQGIKSEQIESMVSYAAQNSWDASARLLFKQLMLVNNEEKNNFS